MLNKTKRQKKDYIRKHRQLSFLNEWIEKNEYIIKKTATSENMHIFQKYRNYKLKIERIKRLLFIS